METNTNANRVSAPKFTVSAERVGNLNEYVVTRDGEIVAVLHDPNLARVIESHAGLVEALEEAQTLMPLGTTKRAEWMKRAWAALAKARGEG